MSDGNSLILLAEYVRKNLNQDLLEATDAIHDAGIAAVRLTELNPISAVQIAHKKLHVFPFKDVPLCWRRVYEEACLHEACRKLENAVSYACDNDEKVVRVHEVINPCDRAIIFAGAPYRRWLIDLILEWIELEGPNLVSGAKSRAGESDRSKSTCSSVVETTSSNKRRRLCSESSRQNSIPNEFPTSSMHWMPNLDKQQMVERQDRPSLAKFEDHVLRKQTPLVLTNTLHHWPALSRWQNPQYWDRVTLGGRRLIPVELGKTYIDEGWGQRIMDFNEFMWQHLLKEEDQCRRDDEQVDPVGYLAQYDLFAQIPALRKDIAIPDYCNADTPASTHVPNEAFKPTAEPHSPDPHQPMENDGISNTDEIGDNKAEPLFNIWLGPANTISPAHTDPHHNILAQVFGTKYVRLFPPSERHKMYPMSQTESTDPNDSSEDDQYVSHGVDMGNTSRVDVGSFVPFKITDPAEKGQSTQQSLNYSKSLSAEKVKFPEHATAQYFETTLEAGDCLYIPKGWWHYIRSLETSCNVSFWWD